MNYFYFTEISNGFIRLDEDESKHLQLVLRHKPGNVIHLLNGDGLKVEGFLHATDKKGVTIKVEKTVLFPKKDFQLHVAIGPTKQMERFEWFLEKATELGIDSITPFTSTHGERDKLRMDRLEKIIRTAGKHSANPNFPKLINGSTEKNKYIAHLDQSSKGHFFDVIPKGENVLILIGPEGDFTEKEVETAKSHGFLSVHLGENRLRTETAGIFATQCLILKNK
jgi:16S rRNA (uracil1498-N3)-methyltransferase